MTRRVLVCPICGRVVVGDETDDDSDAPPTPEETSVICDECFGAPHNADADD